MASYNAKVQNPLSTAYGRYQLFDLLYMSCVAFGLVNQFINPIWFDQLFSSLIFFMIRSGGVTPTFLLLIESGNGS
jgi:muramidase (phage lysozyme)